MTTSTESIKAINEVLASGMVHAHKYARLIAMRNNGTITQDQFANANAAALIGIKAVTA